MPTPFRDLGSPPMESGFLEADRVRGVDLGLLEKGTIAGPSLDPLLEQVSKALDLGCLFWFPVAPVCRRRTQVSIHAENVRDCSYHHGMRRIAAILRAPENCNV